MIKNFLKKSKEFLGMEEIEEQEEINEEDIFEAAPKDDKVKNKDKKGFKNKKNQLSKDDELLLDEILQPESKSEETLEVTEEERYQTIFIDPKDFSECKKIANYIRNDQMVTLNLEYLD
nr:cell division protein SepF [Fusobacteriaceae bacterium]